ncbi:hypothetical protein CKO28_19455 [Rhodovibrio sodomensis]|uniref:Sulfate exporter family transporter n=1 Tax=Rhodovibrio sodomensis TaxID=1088 RepID=A0ABS1DJ28_9PROT|nr:putative sulfate exporter family transporter [Rhodovibrio sodomensis]MBK1670214.1 hypothetical protein [Rhodovibrio sodomensis]
MTEEIAPPARWVQIRGEARRLFPGLLVCLTIAAAARFLANHYGAPHMLFALLLGMAFHFLSEDTVCRPGIDIATKYVLRTGVALLGTRITVEAVMSLGLGAVALVGTGTFLTIAVGILISRAAGYPKTFGVLTGGAVGICGASAALAIAAVLPSGRKSEQNTVFAVIAVTTLSTIAMIVYPIIARSLGLETLAAGLFLGGTIHDVAQVVGAGYSLSTEIGDTSTITKLFRVAMLVPVVFVLSLAFGRQTGPSRQQLPVPLFVLAFCALVAINSAGWIPAGIARITESASGWFLVAAIAGLGIKTSLKQLAQVGPGPVAVMVAESLFLAGWVLGGAVWLL